MTCSVRNLAALSAVLSDKMAAYSSLEKSSMATNRYLGQAFHSVLCLFETVVGAGLGFEQLGPCGLKCAIDGDAADLVTPCQ